jgi:hypothetical protein
MNLLPIAVLLTSGFLLAACGPAAVSKSSGPKAVPPADSIPILDLLSEYRADRERVEAKYLGQTVIVHGRGLYNFSDVITASRISVEGDRPRVSGAVCWPPEARGEYYHYQPEFRELHGKGLVLQGTAAEFFNGARDKAVMLSECEIVGTYDYSSTPEQSTPLPTTTLAISPLCAETRGTFVEVQGKRIPLHQRLCVQSIGPEYGVRVEVAGGRSWVSVDSKTGKQTGGSMYWEEVELFEHFEPIVGQTIPKAPPRPTSTKEH